MQSLLTKEFYSMLVRYLLSAMTAAIIAIPAVAQDKLADPPIALRIGYLKGTTDLTLAKAHGSLEKALEPRGVHVTWAGPFPASAPAVEALNAGAVDLTGGSSTSYIASRAGGVRLVMFAYQPQSAGNEGIVVRADSQLHSLADLKGHTVAVNRGGTGEYLLVRALEKAGVPVETVNRAYLPPADSSVALSSGHVDAWATWDPFLSVSIENNGVRLLANGTEAGSENAIAFFVNEDFLKVHRNVIAAVFEVLKAENAWGREHKLEAGRIWTRELGLPENVALRLGENNTNPIGPVNIEAEKHIEHIADWYVENKIIPKRPNIAHFVTDITSTR
jgi:sulfonate transport system substrate-binding protein